MYYNPRYDALNPEFSNDTVMQDYWKQIALTGIMLPEIICLEQQFNW